MQSGNRAPRRQRDAAPFYTHLTSIQNLFQKACGVWGKAPRLAAKPQTRAKRPLAAKPQNQKRQFRFLFVNEATKIFVLKHCQIFLRMQKNSQIPFHKARLSSKPRSKTPRFCFHYGEINFLDKNAKALRKSISRAKKLQKDLDNARKKWYNYSCSESSRNSGV